MNSENEPTQRARKWRFLLEGLREADAWVVSGGWLRHSEQFDNRWGWPCPEGAAAWELGLQFVREFSGLKEVPPLKVFSKVEVRRYRDSEQVERLVGFDRSAFLEGVRNHRSRADGLLVLAFSHERQPFRSELLELRDANKPTVSLAWPDPHGRAFSTLAAVWAPAEGVEPNSH